MDVYAQDPAYLGCFSDPAEGRMFVWESSTTAMTAEVGGKPTKDVGSPESSVLTCQHEMSIAHPPNVFRDVALVVFPDIDIAWCSHSKRQPCSPFRTYNSLPTHRAPSMYLPFELVLTPSP